ncbi:MAG TPA: hypothetical protein VJ739_14545, partial [Gemmataceae bacterium]|nr:hypothetical protein [Gemmataceae bacterium]
MSARRWLALASFVVCLCLLAGLSTAPGGDETGNGNQKKGTNIGKAPGKSSSAAEAVRQTRLAHELIDYGRRARSPEALITAAEILAAVPAAERKNDGPKETRRLGSEGSGAKGDNTGAKPSHTATAHGAGHADDPAALL